MENVYVTVFDTKNGPSLIEAYADRDQAEREKCKGSRIVEVPPIRFTHGGRKVVLPDFDRHTQVVDFIGAD